MGYTGSSATINPDITLESIVKLLAGDADVNKQRVPMPTSPEDEETDITGRDKSSANEKDIFNMANYYEFRRIH